MTKRFMGRLTHIIDMPIFATSLIALTALLIGVRALGQAGGAPVVKIDGSSTVFPITEAVAEEFQNAEKNKSKVTVGVSGTGGGFKKFCRGETDIQNASRPIQTSELEECKKNNVRFIELPIAYDAIAVVMNLKANWIDQITVEELKKIWEPAAQGKITRWNQVNSKWPDQPLQLFGPGADSGTFDYFTEAIVGKAKSSRGDFTASEDDNTIVQGVTSNANGLGYFGIAYLEANKKKLKALNVVGGPKSPMKDKPMSPTKENVENASYWPLSRPVFIYVSEPSLKKPEVRRFAEFYMKNARKLVSEVKYIPLPEKAYQMGLEHLTKNKIGTVFAGHSEVGIKVEDLMKREGNF